MRFGSVGGGGRYDGLVSRFMGQPVPATGFSIGVSRLQAALTALGKLGEKRAPGPVLVTVFDRDRIADYQKTRGTLRNAGHPRRALSRQSEARSRPAAQICRPARRRPAPSSRAATKRNADEVQIKDLILGAGLTEIKDRDEYLKKQAEAQFAVKEDDLVEEVRKLLARHA